MSVPELNRYSFVDPAKYEPEIPQQKVVVEVSREVAIRVAMELMSLALALRDMYAVATHNYYAGEGSVVSRAYRVRQSTLDQSERLIDQAFFDLCGKKR